MLRVMLAQGPFCRCFDVDVIAGMCRCAVRRMCAAIATNLKKKSAKVKLLTLDALRCREKIDHFQTHLPGREKCRDCAISLPVAWPIREGCCCRSGGCRDSSATGLDQVGCYCRVNVLGDRVTASRSWRVRY